MEPARPPCFASYWITRGNYPPPFFYNTDLTFEELLTFTCNELALPVEGRGRLAKIRLLNDLLIGRLERGRTAALLIDEAQNLSDDVLQNLRLLSNLETGNEKLLQIVLAGQRKLESLLDQAELRQLKQRITLGYRLARLMDLIKEFNPQLQDPNWISFDSGLRLPPITKETLQRKQPDGSYHLILA